LNLLPKVCCFRESLLIRWGVNLHKYYACEIKAL
jgi:hypothetical protein